MRVANRNAVFRPRFSLTEEGSGGWKIIPGKLAGTHTLFYNISLFLRNDRSYPASNLSRLPASFSFSSRATHRRREAGFSLSLRTVGRVPSFSRVYVGKALDISGRRPRETQFLGACSALAWSTLAGRRYLGSFTPNVETESWHNFRRRRWRAQLTPFHASATIPPALSRCTSPRLSLGLVFSLSL